VIYLNVSGNAAYRVSVSVKSGNLVSGGYMPWKVVKSKGSGYDIVKADTGKKVGHSDSKVKADASVRARYANYKGK
jgi:hypothetical protein